MERTGSVTGPVPRIDPEFGQEARKHAPATLRNRDAILSLLAVILPPAGRVLEIASGSGEHIVYFGSQRPELEWLPSDPDAAARASIAAWREEAGLANVAPPLALDTLDPRWPLDRVDAILCINMVHICPWDATIGLFEKAAALLPLAAPLFLYGPFIREGVKTAPSNIAFDESLRGRNPDWGLRKVSDLDALAKAHGFRRDFIYQMPANNLSLVYRRT